MKNFTKLTEELNKKKTFKVDVKISLLVKAHSEGDAGYIADTIIKCADVADQIHYEVMDISLYNNNENILEKKEEKKEQSAGDIIKTAWLNKPTGQTFHEFYHKMRLEGYDEDVIKNNVQE